MSKSRAKGTRWETELVEFLHENGHPAVERRALGGNKDKGDIAGIPEWAFEAKSAKELRLGEYLDELRVEMRNARALFGAVLIKRRGKGAAGAYALLPMEVLTLLLSRRAFASQPAATPHIPAQERTRNLKASEAPAVNSAR